VKSDSQQKTETEGGFAENEELFSQSRDGGGILKTYNTGVLYLLAMLWLE
jgi:hypothetical protein